MTEPAVVLARDPVRPAAADAVARRGVRVEVAGCERRFGRIVALGGVDLTIEPGELIALLGPSGCGKTTLLRALAGLEELDAGTIRLGGIDVTALAPNRRQVGMVFQAYSLFPNLTALANVSFGLRLRGVASAARRRRAGELLELVGLGAHGDRFPHQLSGGQQQRVALARAIAVEPRVLLLDEPLSALDAKVRTQLRDEIRRIQLTLGITTLYVTHDQDEALSVADRVGVMDQGRLQQLASPHIVYERPANAFVAEFVGSVSRLPATVGPNGTVEVLGRRLPLPPSAAPAAPGDRVDALVRPETVAVRRDANGLGLVVGRAFLGAVSRLDVALPGEVRLIATVTSIEATTLGPGVAVSAEVTAPPLFVTAPSSARSR